MLFCQVYSKGHGKGDESVISVCFGGFIGSCHFSDTLLATGEKRDVSRNHYAGYNYISH